MNLAPAFGLPHNEIQPEPWETPVLVCFPKHVPQSLPVLVLDRRGE
jgi:hypothetical protein